MSKNAKRNTLKSKNSFIEKHVNQVSGHLSCPDRIIFKGHLPLSSEAGITSFFAARGILIKDFKKTAMSMTGILTDHAKQIAEKAGRPYEYLNDFIRKEDHVRKLIERDGVKKGLVCVLARVEQCSTYRMTGGKGKPVLKKHRGKCTAIYFYEIDPEFGLMHTRIQTWFPFTVQVYVNGHEWLAGKLTKKGVSFTKKDNRFAWISNLRTAHRAANGLARKNWVRFLDGKARFANPLLKDMLSGMRHYWVIDQFEYSTDVMFKDPKYLVDLKGELFHHALTAFSPSDVMNFFQRSGPHGNFRGRLGANYNRNTGGIFGTRLKFRMKNNTLKIYDDGGVLRFELTINNPREFKRPVRDEDGKVRWEKLNKGVFNFRRFVEIGRRADADLMKALACCESPHAADRRLNSTAAGKKKKGRHQKGFNPLLASDQKVFLAVMNGDGILNGFRNRDVRNILHPNVSERDRKRVSAQVSRLLNRLHAHGLVAKIPRSRRWRVTDYGRNFMNLSISIHRDKFRKAEIQRVA